MGVKFRSPYVLIIFNSKIDRDIIAAQFAEIFQEIKPVSSSPITIVGTSTPRNGKWQIN